MLIRKSIFFLSLSTFFLGMLLAGSIVLCIENQTILLLEDGDKDDAAFHYSQAVQEYQSAQKLWPLLSYDKAFTVKLESEKKILVDLQSRPAVTIFFKNSANQKEINSLIQVIKNTHGVKKITYISQEDALRIYKEQHKNDPLLTDIIKAKLLPASIQVYISDNSIKDHLEEITHNQSFVDVVTKTPNY